MTQEDKKELLLKDLCARLPYGVICHIEIPYMFIGYVEKGDLPLNSIKNSKCDFITCWGIDIDYVKPYLRPMSSMTEEEYKEYDKETDLDTKDSAETLKENLKAKSRVRVSKWYHGTDWLNAHHFDYRGLIEKGLAIEAPEGMYK